MARVLTTEDTIYLSGRKPLLTSVEEQMINETTIPEIMKSVSDVFERNAYETDVLLSEYLGLQSILKREREFVQEINNKIVVNRSREIVRKSVSYFLGEPVTYTLKKNQSTPLQVGFDALAMFLEDEAKTSQDMDIGYWAAICGTAYRLVLPNPDVEVDGTPFKIATCDPRKTFIVYSADVLQRPLFSGVMNPIYNASGVITGYDHWIYDKEYEYRFESIGNIPMSGTMVFQGKTQRITSENPIIEYVNNQFRVGDFEPVLGLLNALNLSLSDRVNAIEQAVGSILVFIDCEPDEGGTEKIKQKGTLGIKSNGNGNVEIKYVTPELSQKDAQIAESTINAYIEAVTGIPSRNDNGGGGGDTGDAVFLRDGFQDLELVARDKERSFKMSERKLIRILSKILSTYGYIIDSREIEINCIRNRVTNILNKSQAFANFVSTKFIDPQDALMLVGVTDQPKEMALRGIEFNKTLSDQIVKAEEINTQEG